MSELCLECLNQLMGTNDPPQKYIISRNEDLCEECGEWKPVVIAIKRRYLIQEGVIELITVDPLAQKPAAGVSGGGWKRSEFSEHFLHIGQATGDAGEAVLGAFILQ